MISVLSAITITIALVTLVLSMALGGTPDCIPETVVDGVAQEVVLSTSWLPRTLGGMADGLPIMSLALGAQFAIPSLYNSLGGTNRERGYVARKGVHY
ncbi:hypothetical protein KIPB_017186, partial [Kipferlia bialata]|eukprot:g17186.t1